MPSQRSEHQPALVWLAMPSDPGGVTAMPAMSIGFGMVRMSSAAGCAGAPRGADGVGEERAPASADPVMKRGVGDGADASGRDEPGEEAFEPRGAAG